MKNIINWKVFFILFGLGIISVLCVLPYVLTIQGDLLRSIGQPLWLLFTAQIIQTAILFSVAIFFGLLLSKKVGFHLPLLEAYTEKGDYGGVFKNIIGISVGWGIITAVLIYVIDIVFSVFGAAISTHQNIAPVWQKLLAAVYGGTTEEIIMRLFIMLLFVWIGMKITRREKPSSIVIVISIILAAIIFGLGHLPITASLTALTPLIIVRALVLNGIGGIVFGVLFWKKGFESAMIAHFTTDIFLLTLLPLIFT